MSYFVANNCKLDGDTIINLVSWSNVDPIAALSTVTTDEKERKIHKVQFMNNEGGIISNSTLPHSAGAVAFDWQPSGRILAVGWADGMISCWQVDGRIRPTSTFSNTSQHNTAITVLKWNPFGKRVVSGDTHGLINVWTADVRGTLTPTRQYRKKGSITAAVFCRILSPNAPRGLQPLSAAVLSGKSSSSSYSPAFFFSTDRGGLVYADDLGHCTDVQQLSSSVDIMLYYEERARLVVITRSLLLTQYQVAEDGRVTRLVQVKLSVAGSVAENGLNSVIWAGPGILAAATNEKLVRLLDLAADESYNLSLGAIGGDLVNRNDCTVKVAFNPVDRYLAVGTQGGVLAIWKYVGSARQIIPSTNVQTKHGASNASAAAAATATSATDWELRYSTSFPSTIIQLTWYRGQGTLGVLTDDGVIAVSETIMNNGFCDNLSVLQISNNEVSVIGEGKKDIQRPANVVPVGLTIKGLAVSRTSFVVWNGKLAKVYKVHPNSGRCEAMDPFPTSSKCVQISDPSYIVDDSIFLVEDGMVKTFNIHGVQKGSVTFSEAEGVAELLHVHGKYLAIVTSKGYIKVLDIHTPNKPKAMGSIGKFHTDFDSSLLSIRQIKCNCDGTKIAILADYVAGVALQLRFPDSRVYVYDRNKGGVYYHDCTDPSLPFQRYPMSLCWDTTDERVLVVETQLSRTSMPASAAAATSPKDGASASFNNKAPVVDAAVSSANKGNEIEIIHFFATAEHGLLIQDSYTRSAPFGDVLGIVVPKVFFRGANNSTASPSSAPMKVFSKIMRDFIGVNEIDDEVKIALLDFSYNLTLGKLDEAYRCVKSINSPSIWENMAQMCVKTQRLDVAEVCLGNMGHARGAAALREARKAGLSSESCVGILAVQLGLLDEAVRLFKGSSRFDLLNKLYQASGLWGKAVKIASTSDRIHMKTTHYQYAKHLESVGDVSGAIHHFEKSETHRTEVPRMLYSLNKMDDLEDYVHKSDDQVLLKWWGSYLESNERYDKARVYYDKAGDSLSLVRICCFKGEFAKAAEIVQTSADRAAAYHFARQLENQGELKDAITFYASSGCYNHAIRLARAYNLDSELMRFAVKSTPSLMLDCANHFEAKGEWDKAVQLYHKGGDLPRALDLCFRAGSENGTKGNANSMNASAFDMLNTIAQDLGVNTSPQTLARCAEFLVQHKHYDKAIDLYLMAKKYNQAIEMCSAQKVTMTEDMCAKLSPPLGGDMDPNERKDILKELAKLLKKQGLFSLASKKYTESGDRIRAIKCLVRSGDTRRVIDFANISRNIEIYTLAANYLQQMNWREDITIMKAIVLFYTKAKSFEQLSGFYESCAQVEIDEYRDYEKAAGALRESVKHLAKAGTKHCLEIQDMLEKRIALIDKFILARNLSTRDAPQMVELCDSLLDTPSLEEAIRAGDLLAMLIEHFHGTQEMKEAYRYLQIMEQRDIVVLPFLDSRVYDDLCRHFGRNEKSNSNRETESAAQVYSNDDGEEDEVDEDIEEEDVPEIEEEEEEDFNPRQRGNNSYNNNNRGYRK